MEEGSGFRFWAGFAGIVLAAGIVGLILLIIFSRAVYAWGFFGAFLLFVAVMLVIAWFYDRRQKRL